jgi:acyl dehydratase
VAKRDAIGKEFPGRDWYVERGKIVEFAKSIGDLNPVYWNREEARERGLTDVVAPPTFVMSSGLQAPPGGPSFNILEEAGFDRRRILHGEQEFEFFRPVVAGDVLHSHSRIADITEREGRRGGKMTMALSETIYTDGNGETVMISRNLLIERGATPAE